MRKSDFHYLLPPHLIAQQPLSQRSASRLLVLEGDSGALKDSSFLNLPDLLRPGDLLVFNDTRVLAARLFGQKASGGRIELLIERVVDEHGALAHIRASKSPKAGAELFLHGDYRCRVVGREGELFAVAFDREGPGVYEVLAQSGHIPLPPYIAREDAQEDHARYQTVYARRLGAVAAPTAGLHFDDAMLNRLAVMGVETAHVTLHVGSGTFQPLRVENLDEHQMHSEWCELDAATAARINSARERGGRVIAVGTTSVRTLETAARSGVLEPFSGETRLFIRPGFAFHCVDAMLTNFHLPESTLLTLVCAFAGYERVMSAYRHAVAQEYRFFSYGDAMFVTRKPD